MLQMESKVAVADNTGARQAKMIGVIGKRTKSARVGDIITAHIRESIPTAAVKKAPWLRLLLFAPPILSAVPMVPFCALMRTQS